MTNFFFKYIKNLNYKSYLLVIYLFWLGSLLMYFFFSEYVKAGALEGGVKLGNDSTFYLRETTNILNGDISFLQHKSKFGYLLFLLPFLYMDLPLYSVVLSQILITSIAAICLYKITEKYFCKLSGVICVGLFLLYFPLQIRNFYILTEMLFIDISLILSFFIVFFKKQYLPVVVGLLLFLISIRPNGILFLFSLLICVFFFLIKNKRYLYLGVYLALGSIILLPVIGFLNAYLQDLNLIKGLNKGIIWGYSFETGKICKSSCLNVELINNDFSNSLLGYLQFVSINFIEYFKIFFYKIFWMIIRARPYYSDLHNSYILILDLVMYLSFIYGFIKKPKNLFSLNLINFYILFSIILVGLTFADWSGRFSLYILPFIMIFSSYGILIFVKKILKMINQKRENAA
jgi:hypothetical protein